MWTLAGTQATSNVLVAGLTADAWNKWTLEAPVYLAAGDTYWIVCRTNEAASVENRVNLRGESARLYSSGDVVVYINGAYTDSTAFQDLGLIFGCLLSDQ